MKVLVTGATGFVGVELCKVLASREYEVVRVLRDSEGDQVSVRQAGSISIDSIDSRTDWSARLRSIDVIVHLAAKVHVMRPGPNPERGNFREVNVAGTKRLAEAAADSGVKRVIFISTIKVNGESTHNTPFSSDQTPSPVDPYAISKLEAERELRKIEQKTGIEVVVIRPPLIYGEGVKGNLKLLSSAIRSGIPLPLGAVRNRRDLVSVYNLCDLIRVCIENDNAAGKTFLVADNESLSTADLVRYLAAAQGMKHRLFNVPVWLISGAARIFGQKAEADRLLGNLEIDTRYTTAVLGWKPPLSVADSFKRMHRDD